MKISIKRDITILSSFVLWFKITGFYTSHLSVSSYFQSKWKIVFSLDHRTPTNKKIDQLVDHVKRKKKMKDRKKKLLSNSFNKITDLRNSQPLPYQCIKSNLSKSISSIHQPSSIGKFRFKFLLPRENLDLVWHIC